MKVPSLANSGADRPKFIWMDGQILPWAEARVHVNAVGHASVSAAFEGIKAYLGTDRRDLALFRVHDHMQRLLETLRIVRLRSPFTANDLVAATLELLRANGADRDTYVRPWAFIAGIVNELVAPADLPTTTVIDTWPFRSSMLAERGCRACVSSWTRIADNVMPPRAKVFSNYHNSRLAAMEAVANGHDYPIFLNDRGKVTEGPGSCIALARRGRVIMPSISSGVLESITRATLMRVLPDVLGIEVEEREVDRTELYVADELFFLGTGWEILPILHIDGLAVGKGRMGLLTRSIDRAYHDVVRGVDVRYADWRTPVASVDATSAPARAASAGVKGD